MIWVTSQRSQYHWILFLGIRVRRSQIQCTAHFSRLFFVFNYLLTFHNYAPLCVILSWGEKCEILWRLILNLESNQKPWRHINSSHFTSFRGYQILLVYLNRLTTYIWHIKKNAKTSWKRMLTYQFKLLFPGRPDPQQVHSGCQSEASYRYYQIVYPSSPLTHFWRVAGRVVPICSDHRLGCGVHPERVTSENTRQTATHTHTHW